MQPALKLDVCACGIHTEIFCTGCGTSVCRHCSHQEITSNDPKNIIVTYFCPACKTDLHKNPWGILYWDGLKALYT